MRNFKKFLALVLAMLMVSACAVSVSAAYSDQADINATGYAEAVSILSDLKVMQGSGDGTFNPQGTLTRAEAAVIAAKLDTGAAGQKIDWTSSTCSFADVDAAWSYAYINYVSQHGIMDGIGGNKFNPNGKLTIAEAIVIAVKAAGLRAEVAELDKVSTPSFWATNWISVADNHHLTDKITVFDYTAPCTRAMMAQISYNIFNNVTKISNGFNMVKVSAIVENVSDSKVYIVKTDATHAELTVDRAAFEAAMTATGATGTAESVKGATITMTYSNDNGVVYGVTVNSTTLAFTYADAKLANVKENNANTIYVTLDGQKYVVADKDEENKGTIGSSSVVKAIKITKNTNVNTTSELAPKEDIPTYYSAVAYDDNSDGYYDRVVLDVYNIGTIQANTKDAKTINNVKYTFDTIKDVDGTVKFTNYSDVDANVFAINYTGKEPVFDNETPVLYNVSFNDGTKKWDVDILEVAGTVSGKLVGIGSNYVNIDGNKYTNVEDAVAPAAEYLNQNATIYTIGGQYVKVASAASKTEIEVVVNSAVVKDGKAVVTGYNKSSAYADITITVDGIKDSKLVAKVANQDTKKDSEGKDYNTTVSLGYMDGTTFKPEFTFDEGLIIKLTQTDTGVYVDKTSDTTIANFGTEFEFGTPSEKKLAVKDGYVYVDGVAQKYFVSGSIILEEVVKSDAKDGAYDKISYNKLTAYPEQKNVKCDFKYEDNEMTKVNFIYVSEHSAVSTKTTYKNLAEGQAIVFIKDASVVEATYDKSIYNAVNLFTGEKIQITHTGSVDAGHYYIINAEKAVVEDTTNKWIGKYEVNVEYSGLVGVVKAKPVVKIVDSTPNTTPEYKQDGDVLTFGLDNITVYNAGVLDKDGNVSKADVSKALMTGTTHAVKGDIYVVAGQMIIVLSE